MKLTKPQIEMLRDCANDKPITLTLDLTAGNLSIGYLVLEGYLKAEISLTDLGRKALEEETV